MNKQEAIKHILDQLAHGTPIQTILDPPAPKIKLADPVTGEEMWAEDPDWEKPKLPTWTTVVEWMLDESFRYKWEHARKMGAAYKADHMIVLQRKLEQEHDPRMATKYKVMMEMLAKSAMWDDSKYSDRSIQEIKNTTPQAPDVVKSKVQQLRRELGLSQGVVDVEAKEVQPKKRIMSPLQAQNIQKAIAARKEKAAARRLAKDDPGTGTSET